MANEQKNEVVIDQVSEEYRKETTCPSCGRFVGVFTRCPYCQTLTQKRISVRIFKIISVILSTVGLLLILFFARTIKTPEIQISQLGPLSNFAHVRIVGEVDKSMGIHPEWKSLSFILSQQDASGKTSTIRVSAYSKVAEEIERRGLIPKDGEKISVEGQVRFQKDNPGLLITAVEHLKILSSKPQIKTNEVLAISPSGVGIQHLGRTVIVTGKVFDVAGYPSGLTVRIENGSDGLIVWIPSKVADKAQAAVQIGDTIEAKGLVKKYRDTIEVEVQASEGLRILTSGSEASGTPSAEKIASDSELSDDSSMEPNSDQEDDLRPLFHIASITSEMVDKEVRISGILKKIDEFKSGIKLLVQDDSGEIIVWIDNDLAAGMIIPSAGAKISAEGPVEIFKDKLQINPVSPEDFSVLP
ncbi:MAG: hypothetical protein HQM10_24955 [Candidatus Riflebacteria bacterium]|nr:hypothetical protein [Candidatus Riflebacteria bacterium]